MEPGVGDGGEIYEYFHRQLRDEHTGKFIKPDLEGLTPLDANLPPS